MSSKCYVLELKIEDGTKVTDIGPEKAEQSLIAIIVHILMRFYLLRLPTLNSLTSC